MCIPIELDVPVVTLDHHEIGTAREIICACPADGGSDQSLGLGLFGPSESGDELWLRVTQPGHDDLYIPFGQIAATLADGVRLRVTRDDVSAYHWERIPAGLPVPA